MTPEPLGIIWYLIIALVLAVYMVLDGFDLGAGFWSLFEEEDGKRTILKLVGPFWDGNEVWLLTAAGALFAAFPRAYAAILSGLYAPLVLVICCLIFRAVAIEFFGKHDAPGWRRAWGLSFGIGSALPALLLGVALGNLLRGIPLDAGENYSGNSFQLLNPFAILCGVAVFALVATHGASWLAWRTEGEMRERFRRRGVRVGIASLGFVVLFLGTCALVHPALLVNFRDAPNLTVLPLISLTAQVATILFLRAGNAPAAFGQHATALIMLVATAAAAAFPSFVSATGAGGEGITVGNAASSHLTLTAMLVITGLGLPFVIGYHVWIYRVFSKE